MVTSLERAPGRALGIGLYGCNGHQITSLLETIPAVRLVACACIERVQVPAVLQHGDVAWYGSLDDLLKDERVELVSLCSPRRRDQALEARRCLEAGRHVYAEKPCAMTEADLDGLITLARKTGLEFHEMAGTAFDQPFYAARQCVAAGTLGDVVQVLAHKSYPYFDGRAQHEDIDGGLICQNAIHAVRMVEHVAGVRFADLNGIQTGFGNPVVGGGLQMAASLIGRLENGGVASIVANYLNPRGFGRWGNDQLRIFGTRGMVEITDNGTRTRLVVGDEDRGPLDASLPVMSYFHRFVATLCDGVPMPLSLEDELHPTRMVIRAREKAH